MWSGSTAVSLSLTHTHPHTHTHTHTHTGRLTQDLQLLSQPRETSDSPPFSNKLQRSIMSYLFNETVDGGIYTFFQTGKQMCKRPTHYRISEQIMALYIVIVKQTWNTFDIQIKQNFWVYLKVILSKSKDIRLNNIVVKVTQRNRVKVLKHVLNVIFIH